MQELKALYESLNLENVETYIQSGNVVFDSLEPNASQVSQMIEKKIMKAFAYSVTVLIRTMRDFQRILENNPFVNERDEDVTKLHVTFLSDAPSQSALDAIAGIESEADEFSASNKELYIFCPNGYGRTKLNNNFFEKKLGVVATTRNWKTVNKLYEIAREG